ncbi:hypothetical protein [Pseudomonas soli]|uniref:hypothetical protein n=1 Tax=Pseudomonas soli TaxID=1306993 RepID=UPI0037F4B68E
MELVDRVAERLKPKDRLRSGSFDRVDNIYVYLSPMGLGFELKTDQGVMHINIPNEEEQRMLYGLLAKLEISGKPVEVMGGVQNGKFFYLSY